MPFTYPSGVLSSRLAGRRGTSTGTGTTAGINGLVQSDPFYMQIKALMDAQGQTDQTRLGTQLSQMLVDFGEVPEGFQSPYLPATTGALAGQATEAGLSLLARLNRASEDARRSSVNDLAARGILSSGETGWQLGRLAQARKETEYDARREMLLQWQQMQDAFANANLQRQLALIEAAQNAYGRQASRTANLNYGGY